MADAFADQLRSELDGIQAELERLEEKRRLIEQLLSLESGSNAAASGSSAASAPARRASRRTAPTAKGPRRPRGLITGTIRAFLAEQREPVHATEILAYLERQDAAPRSDKPMATLQNALHRLKEQGEVENTGRNRWRLRTTETTAAAPPATPTSQAPSPAAAAGPPVVTSTRTFGSRFGAGE